MSATATEPGSTAIEVDETLLPPRPALSPWMMRFGFVFRPTQFFEEAQRRTGDYFTLEPERGRLMVATADPEAVKQVFTGDPDLLHAGEANYILAPVLGRRSVLLLDGPEHLRQRKLMLPPFHGERMRGYVRAMREAADWHIAGWPRNRSFSSLPSMQAITLDVIMRVVFGIHDERERERLSKPLRAQLDMVGNRLTVLLLFLFSSTDGSGGPRGPWVKVAALRREADKLIYEQIRSRREDPHGTEPNDIFSLLLAARDEEGQSLSDSELRDELMTLLLAGHETTATAMAWTLERIVRHPEVLARLREEPDGEYLDAVIKETLRLRPVVPAVARKLMAPMEIGGWQLPAGVHIMPSIYLLHRRADIYPDPNTFRPERFLERQPGTYEWIPFGGGIRRCLGASFALMEMNVVLGTILRTVELKPSRTGGESVARRAITFAPNKGGRIALAAR